MNKQYILTSIERKIGHMNNSWIYELTWVDVDTLEVFTMTVDSSYRNYKRSGWDVIIQTNQLGVYTNLKKRPSANHKDDLPVLDADSKPVLDQHLTQKQIDDVLDLIRSELGYA